MLTTCINGLTVSFDDDAIGPWVCEKTGGTWVNGRGTAIGLVKGGEIQAGVLYEDFSGSNIVCHIAGQGGWASRSFLALIFHYPFVQLGAKRITAPVGSTNVTSINLVCRMGFELECTLDQAIPEGDLHLFRMWRHDCKYLKGPYGKVKLSTAS